MENIEQYIRNGYTFIAVVAVVSYLIGSVNFSILLSRIIGKKDIRESGSGNAGATNMLRTYGKKMGVITLLLDVAKGIAAILLANFLGKFMAEEVFRGNIFLGPLDISEYIAGVCVVLGHNFPLYFGFKGGKGVATSLGVVMMLDWKVGLIVMVIALAIMAITRYVSLGSIVGGALFIVLEIAVKVYECIQGTLYCIDEYPVMDKITGAIHNVFTSPFSLVRVSCVIIIGGLLIARHHANIKRLLNGTENKLGAKKGE